MCIVLICMGICMCMCMDLCMRRERRARVSERVRERRKSYQGLCCRYDRLWGGHTQIAMNVAG